MKIGILTYYKENNYGSLLQAYALCSFLKSLGHSPALIDVTEKSKQYIVNKKKRMSKQRLLNLERKVFLKLNMAGFRDHELRRNIVFERFREEEFSIVPYDDNINEYFDAFISGSDQIWNCSFSLKKVFYLDFVAANKLKIAYAPSFGTKTVPRQFQGEVRSLLDSFNALSVRETQGEKIIRDLLGANVPTVCDPTFLINRKQWALWVNNDSSRNEYILCYFLGEKSLYWNAIKKIAKTIKKKVIVLPGTANSIVHGYQCDFDCGPKEFVNLIANAYMVCTDSFHGMVFSILFHRNFIAFKRFKESDYGNQNSRIEDLLSFFGLEYKYVLDSKTKIPMGIPDYKNVDKKLHSYIKDSEEYLISALEIKV